MNLARASDPITSHAAGVAAVQFITRHQALILDALKDGPAGKDGIAARTKLDGVSIARRLPELERIGAVKPTGKTVPSKCGRQEREWRLTGQTND